MSKEALPTAPEAEKAVLASILLDDTMMPAVVKIVKERDFVDDRNRAIYRQALRDHRNGRPVDAVLITQALRGEKLFEPTKSEPNPVHTTLAKIGKAVATAAHAEHYATIVANNARKRRAILLASDTLERLRNDGDVNDCLSFLRSGAEELQHVDEGKSRSSEDILERLATAIKNRERPQIIECGPFGSDVGKFPIVPGQMSMLGALPGGGKTAFFGQITFDALRAEGQEGLRLLNANVEMSPQALLTRQSARLSGVSYSYIDHRDYGQEALPRIETALAELRALMPRIEFMTPPFTLEHLLHRAEAFAADIVVVDYIQRFASENRLADLRSQTNMAMEVCRALADQGRAVLVVAALNRAAGNGQAGLASFRESSELEYGADSAWLLLREPDSDVVELKCVKNRTGRLQTLNLLFDPSRQLFRDDPSATEWNP